MANCNQYEPPVKSSLTRSSISRSATNITSTSKGCSDNFKYLSRSLFTRKARSATNINAAFEEAPFNSKCENMDTQEYIVLPGAKKQQQHGTDSSFVQASDSRNSSSDKRMFVTYSTYCTEAGEKYFPFQKHKIEEAVVPTYKEMSGHELGFDALMLDKWNEEINPLRFLIYFKIKEIIANNIKPNTIVLIGTDRYPCHLIVLQLFSSFFDQFSNEFLIRLPEKKVTSECFRFLYQFLLDEQMVIKRSILCDLFVAANFLEVKPICDLCWLCFDNEQLFNEDTAFQLYLECKDRPDLQPLPSLMITRIRKFFLSFVATANYVNSSLEEVLVFLNSSEIAVNSEVEIFFCAIRWLNHDWKQREQYLMKFIEIIRFELFPPMLMFALSQNIQCELLRRVAQDERVLPLIQEGLVNSYLFQTMITKSTNKQQYLQSLFEHNLREPTSRRWIRDKNCTYLNVITEAHRVHLIYNEFMKYLEIVRNGGRFYWKTLEEV